MANKTNPNQEGWNRNTELGCDDGSLNLNFKSLKVEAGFTVDGYALGVCNELRQALGGLVEE